MTYLCKSCGRENFENPFEYQEDTPSLRIKFKRYTINNIKLDEVDKILYNYIAIYKKNYDIYFLNCKFVVKFDNNFTKIIETNYIFTIESEKMINILLYAIKWCELMGYNFCCVNQMTISILIDKCNITYEKYINNPVNKVERRININIAKNPQLVKLFDRNKNHPLVRKYSHIPFNN